MRGLETCERTIRRNRLIAPSSRLASPFRPASFSQDRLCVLRLSLAAIKTKRADRKGPRQSFFMGGGGRPVKEAAGLGPGSAGGDGVRLVSIAVIRVENAPYQAYVLAQRWALERWQSG